MEYPYDEEFFEMEMMNIIGSGVDAYHPYHPQPYMGTENSIAESGVDDAYHPYHPQPYMGTENPIAESGVDAAYHPQPSMGTENPIAESGVDDAYHPYHPQPYMGTENPIVESGVDAAYHPQPSMGTENPIAESGVDDAYHPYHPQPYMGTENPIVDAAYHPQPYMGSENPIAESGVDAAYHPQPYMGIIENTRSMMNNVESGDGQQSMGGIIITNTHMNNNNVEIGGSSNNNNQEEAKAAGKKKRLAEHQMQQLEAFYAEVPYPDEAERIEFSKAVGLTPSQVKFWFQNKRTQVKRRFEREESLSLEIENKKLEAENMQYRDALSSSLCSKCSGEYELRLLTENINLVNQIEVLRSIVGMYARLPQMNDPTYDDTGASSSHAPHHFNN